MRINLRQLTAFMMISLQLAALPVEAMVPRSNERGIDFSLVTNYSIFNSQSQLPVVPRVLARDEVSADDLTLRIPPALQAQSNFQSVGTWDQNQATSQANSALGKQVLNTNINRMLQSQKDKGGAIGNTASTLQNTMQTNMAFGGAEPGAVQHNVKVKVDAASGLATMNYTGYINAQVSYGVGPGSTMRAAITQKLDQKGLTNLVIDHTDNHIEHAQHISIAWQF